MSSIDWHQNLMYKSWTGGGLVFLKGEFTKLLITQYIPKRFKNNIICIISSRKKNEKIRYIVCHIFVGSGPWTVKIATKWSKSQVSTAFNSRVILVHVIFHTLPDFVEYFGLCGQNVKSKI